MSNVIEFPRRDYFIITERADAGSCPYLLEYVENGERSVVGQYATLGDVALVMGSQKIDFDFGLYDNQNDQPTGGSAA